MNNQFATRFLLEELEFSQEDEELVKELAHIISLLVVAGVPKDEIIKTVTDSLNINEDGMGGGSTTGGGVTNGASFTSGNGEQYAMGTKKISRKSLGEDAPRLAGEPSKTDRGGARNLSAYTKDGFTKAPSAEEAAKSIKGVEVKDLWGKKALEENYFKFRNETRTRGKSEQFHEAVKFINKKLDEVNKLLEFTGTLKTELSESEDTFEVKTYTKKSMDKVRGKVIEAYQKLKQL